jgi:hypothetical protein
MTLTSRFPPFGRPHFLVTWAGSSILVGKSHGWCRSQVPIWLLRYDRGAMMTVIIKKKRRVVSMWRMFPSTVITYGTTIKLKHSIILYVIYWFVSTACASELRNFKVRWKPEYIHSLLRRTWNEFNVTHRDLSQSPSSGLSPLPGLTHTQGGDDDGWWRCVTRLRFKTSRRHYVMRDIESTSLDGLDSSNYL